MEKTLTRETTPQENVVYYDINWDKIKTIKDIKSILKVLATKIVIDHNDSEDIEVYETLKGILTKSED